MTGRADDDVVDLDGLPLTPSAPGTWLPAHGAPDPHPRERGRRASGRRWLLAAPVVVVVLVAGLLAHRSAEREEPPLASPSAGSDSVPLGASQAAVQHALRSVAPQLAIAWSAPIIGITSDSGAVLDVQRNGLITGTGDGSATGEVHVAYRVVTGVPEQLAAQPCVLPSVGIEAWQFDQGGDPSLACQVVPGPGSGTWALREGRAAQAGTGSAVVVVLEVLLVRHRRTTAVATWSVGDDTPQRLGTDSLRRVVLALDAAV